MSAWETSDRYHIVGVLLWLDDDCPRRGRNRYGCGEELGRFWCKFEPGSSHTAAILLNHFNLSVLRFTPHFTIEGIVTSRRNRNTTAASIGIFHKPRTAGRNSGGSGTFQ